MATEKKSSNLRENLFRNEKQKDIRQQNIVAAKSVSELCRTSLGPRGMDKMIRNSKGGVIITNDGATIMDEIAVAHPAAKMLVELSKAQDVVAGDGTTSVVIIAGALLSCCQCLLDRGVHPQVIADSFLFASIKAEEIIRNMSIKVSLQDRESLIQAANTALCSKVVASNSSLLAPIAVEAVLRTVDVNKTKNVDLRDIRIVKCLGGTIDDTELISGFVFVNTKVLKIAGGPTRVQNAKIGLIQFCLSPPKTDMENTITINNSASMDSLIEQEQKIISKLVRHIASTGCNVLLVQKSILRDAVNDLSLNYLAKSKILVIKDIEREDIEYISKACNCEAISSIDSFSAEKLGSSENVFEEITSNGSRIVKITGVPGKSTVSILCCASNQLMLDESERSLHDALCVIRSLIKEPYFIPGGGATEMELANKIIKWSSTLKNGSMQLCCKYYGEALEIIPFTLAENAGLNPIDIVTSLRNKHHMGEINSGILVKSGLVGDMLSESVLQPLLVTTSAIKLATETVGLILRIDDIVACR